MKTLSSKNAPVQFWIFDLDGTLALIEHRRHLVETMRPPRWKEFYARCVYDTPNPAVCEVFRNMVRIGHQPLIWSGRGGEVRTQTLAWLDKHLLPGYDFEKILTMRPVGDSTPDDVLKRKWLESMDPDVRANLAGVFDDRNKVVNMWRQQGLTCFQVAPGDF